MSLSILEINNDNSGEFSIIYELDIKNGIFTHLATDLQKIDYLESWIHYRTRNLVFNKVKELSLTSTFKMNVVLSPDQSKQLDRVDSIEIMSLDLIDMNEQKVRLVRPNKCYKTLSTPLSLHLNSDKDNLSEHIINLITRDLVIIMEKAINSVDGFSYENYMGEYKYRVSDEDSDLFDKLYQR